MSFALSIHGRNAAQPGVISDELKGAVQDLLAELRAQGLQITAVSLADASGVQFVEQLTPADVGEPVATVGQPDQGAQAPTDAANDQVTPAKRRGEHA